MHDPDGSKAYDDHDHSENKIDNEVWRYMHLVRRALSFLARLHVRQRCFRGLRGSNGMRDMEQRLLEDPAKCYAEITHIISSGRHLVDLRVHGPW